MPQDYLAPLPESFLFGVATADHQVESYEPEFEDIRDIWERRRALTVRGQATDFWHRYGEDIALAQSLGCKTFRFSIAWSRVEPKPGEFNEAAFEHYRQVIETIRAAEMEPIMTLHHFTHPVHVENRGGLTGEKFPEIFADYVTEVVRRFGPLVRYWITFNEPSQLIYGYVKPWWEAAYFMPPGLPKGATFEDQMTAVGQLMRNLFVAHTRARAIIKQTNPDAQVGVNPMLLGLPLWLQRLVDRNVTRLRNPNDLIHQGQRFTERSWLEKGVVDVVLANLTVTHDRANQVAFSEAYYLAAEMLLVKQQSPIQQVKDLAQAVVVVVKGSTATHSIQQLLPTTQVRVTSSYDDALQLLASGQVMALLADDTILLGIMQNHPGQYRLLPERLTEEPYAAAVTKGDRALLNAVDTVVREFKESGHWADRFQAYFPDRLVPDLPRQGRRSTLADLSGKTTASTHLTGRPSDPVQPNTLLHRIKERGYLIVAVKDDVPGFSQRDAVTGELVGLEIDLARAIAAYILGDPTKVQFRITQTGERLSLLRSLARFIEPILKPLSILSSSLTSNWWHLGMAGKLPEFLCPSDCVGQQDFVGFDYYWGINRLSLHRIQQLMDAAMGRYSRAPVWSGVLYSMLKFHAQLFPGKEIMIIENGCVDRADEIDRATYLRSHLHEVQRAHQEGIKVIGYVCWSITSNREWGLKFDGNSDFGLYHIDLDTDPDLKRHPTSAVEAYRTIIQARGIGTSPNRP